ncbi:MAG: hypothetical protein HUU55_13235 [Myxococcales bacterium]|nr:hypothetical protein [Myxococcales bacterium]
MRARAKNVVWLVAMMSWLVGACSTDSGVQKIPSLSVSIGLAGQGGNAYSPTKTYSIPAPDKLQGNASFTEVTYYNIGERGMNLVNVYIAEGSNPYVELLWAENDPTGESLYVSGSPVLSCHPNLSSVSDPALLPPARDGSPTCSFPVSMTAASADSNSYGRRKFWLKYTFDIETQEPNTSPVKLVAQIDWKEDSLTQEGVLVIDFDVEACTGNLVAAPSQLDFLAATPTSAEKLEICMINEGCADLEIVSISLQNPSPGEEFSLEDVPPPGTTIEPVSINPLAQECFKVRYLPQDGGKDTNFVVIETNDPKTPIKTVPIQSDSCIESYELTHTDQVDSGLVYMDFSSVTFPDSQDKIIHLLNTGQCPITLNEVAFQNLNDFATKGGPFWVEVRKNGSSIGFYGKPGAPVANKVVLQNQNDALDVLVHFQPIENVEVESTEVILKLKNGGGKAFNESIQIQAGDPVGELALAPPSLGGSSILSQLWFYSEQTEAKMGELTFYNYGLAPVTVTAVTMDNGFGQPPQDFSLVDDGNAVVDGNFVEQSIDGFGLVNLTVKYQSVSNAFKSTAFLYVWTDEYPLGGGEKTPYVVNLTGFAGFQKILPIANAGDPANYQGVTAGTTITLDGSGSQDGDAEIFDTGYQWWLSAKPAGSAAKLNKLGGALETLKTDLPGTYRVNLIVFGQTSDSTALYSAPHSIDIIVQ